MTFEELVRDVAVSNGLTLRKTEDVIRQALSRSVSAAKNGAAPLFPGIGRFLMVSVRSAGRKPDGTRWTRPGRTKLAFKPSLHQGQPNSHKKMRVVDGVAA